MSKTKWTDERIAKEAALARVGSYSRTPVGWERMIEELLTQIRNDMQSQIDALRQQLAEAQAEIAELRQRLAASRKANSKLLKEANAEIKAFRGILGAEMGALDSEIDDMIYDWMEAEGQILPAEAGESPKEHFYEVPSDDIEDN